MAQLRKLVDGIWTTAVEHHWLAFHVGSRMTVVRLSEGGLFIHSPVPLSKELRAEINALEPVRHIVCPNFFHHMYAGEFAAAYPAATVHGPAALRRKQPELKLVDLSDTPHPDWKNDLIPLTINGCLLQETVFFHPASRTLITCDLVENFSASPHWLTRLWLKLGGVYGRVGWHRLLRLVYRDRKAARASMDRLLQWPFERVVISHGEIVERDARDTIRTALSWL